MRRVTINLSVFNLDKDGFGEAIYEIKTPKNNYHFFVFADFLDPNLRTDRVIAEAWDMTVTLRHGSFNQNELEILRQNVPLQEQGRMPSNCIVLSRANKSSRNFKYVIDQLSSGEQPSIKKINEALHFYNCKTLPENVIIGGPDQDDADAIISSAAMRFFCKNSLVWDVPNVSKKEGWIFGV